MKYSFIDKLNYLMQENGLNKNTLSKSSGIPYTTIDGWYKKGYEGLKLTTIKKLSSALNVDIGYWVDDKFLEPQKSEYDPITGIKKAHASDKSETEATDDYNIFDLMYNVLVSSGFIKDGDDLTDVEIAVVKAAIRALGVTFPGIETFGVPDNSSPNSGGLII